MPTRTLHIARVVGIIAGSAFLLTLTGCVTERSDQRRTYRDRTVSRVQTTVVYQDDYDYYPGHEIYYSRNRREYVYRHNNEWVRRPEPPGISVDVLFSSPSVRLEFHDSPERHHKKVVRTYPRTWKPSEKKHNDRDNRRDDRKRNDRNG